MSSHWRRLLSLAGLLSAPWLIAAGSPAVDASDARVPQALLVREEWRRGTFGFGMGEKGLHVADLDADGDLEIVGESGGFWWIASRDGKGYSQEWVSDDAGRIWALRTVQVDADAPLEVVVAASGRVTVYDGASRQPEISWPTPIQELYGFAVADLDGDTLREVVFCDGPFGRDTLYVYELNSGQQEFAGAGLGCRELAVGNVDNDIGLEIVLARDTDPGLVLDGSTHAVEWSNPAGFGKLVRLGDVDSDGRAEIVATTKGLAAPTLVYDAELQALAGTIPVAYPTVVYAMNVLDVEGDGRPEIVQGDNFGKLRVFDGATRSLKWVATNPEWGGFPTDGFTDFAAGNLDGDSALELVWGSGNATSGPDYLSVFDTVIREHEWRSVDLVGPFRALSHGDIDGDGQPELLYGSLKSDSGYADGLWFVNDAVSKALEFQSGPATAQGSYGLTRLANANVDADPQQEVFVPAEVAFDGALIICYDGASHLEQWRSPFTGDGVAFASMQVGNVDADPGLELVASVELITTGARGVSLYVFDAASGALEWQSPLLAPGGSVNYLRLGNVDGDPAVEMVAGIHGDELFVIDGLSHQVVGLGDQDLSALELHDRDGDGVAEIFVGTRAGDLRVVDLAGTVVQTIATYPGAVSGLRVRDVTGDGSADYVLAVLDEVLIRDGASGVTHWTSEPLRLGGNGGVGAYDSLLLEDVDQDGRLEIVVNIGDQGLRVFEIPPRHDLELSMADSPDPAGLGSPVVYDLAIRNLGAADASALSLVVTLPPLGQFVSSVPGPPTCTASAGVVTCGLGTLAGGATAPVTVTVSTLPPGLQHASAIVTAADPDPNPANNAASVVTTVSVNAQANLALTMDDGRGVVAPASAVAYEMLLTNLGPWPVDSVLLTNTLPPGLTSAAYIPASGSYDAGSGIWSGLGLAAGQSARLRLTAVVSASAAGPLVNTAVVTPIGLSDPFLGNNTATDTDQVVSGLAELAHGSSARSDAQGGGDRYFLMRQQPRSSYELIVDELSGDLGDPAAPVLLQRLGTDLAVLAEGVPAGLGPSRSLRWETAGTAVEDGEAIRVRSAGCTTDCGADDVFRIRAYDTTYDMARFNNGGGQVSVVVIQNAGSNSVSGTVRFWSASGTLLAAVPFVSLAPRGVYALITPTVPSLAGAAGSITVTSDAPYGTLAGKVVSVEPATGFAFDTPMRSRPR